MAHIKLTSLVLFSGIGLLACSQSDGGGGNNTGLGAGTTGTTNVAGATTTTTTTTTTSGGATGATTTPTTSGGTANAVTTAGGATAAGGAAAGGAASTVGASCATTATVADGVSYEEALVDGAAGVYFYGDSVTTFCPTVSAGQICATGIAAAAGADYANYGAGAGVQMAQEVAGVVTPFDAAALGITAVRFTLSGMTVSDTPVRPQVSMANVGAFNFQDNGFITTTPGSIAADGTYTVEFAALALPDWATDLDGDGVDDEPHVFDASGIHSLQFQLETDQTLTRPFDLCVSAIEWLDAAGTPVDVPEPISYTAAAAAGTGGASAGGAGTGGAATGGASTAGASMGGMGGMGGASGGAGGAMGGAGGAMGGTGGAMGGAGTAGAGMAGAGTAGAGAM